MKKLIVGLTLTAAFAANAQTSTTSASAAAPETATTAAASPAPAAQTLTTEAEAAAPNKWGALFWVENTMMIQDQKNLNEKAPVESYWYTGIKYKPTKKIGLELWQMATTRSNFEGSPDANTYNKGERQVMGDMVVKANYKSELTLAGSEQIGFSARYYLPTSQVTQEMLQRNGQLRFDINPSWVLTPLWTFDWVNSPRIIFNKEGSSRGSDTVYRYVGGPAITANFNDYFNAYYMPYFDIRSADVSRGTWAPEHLNLMYHEAGLNITVGPLTINPALISETNLNDGTASFATADSRVYSAENTSYNLNFYANF